MPSQMICWSSLLQLLFLLLLLLAARPAWPLHWGQPRPNWPPFPGAEAQPSNINLPAGPAPQIPLQQSGPSQPHESYNEYLSKLAEYYNDFYTEYGSRYNDYLAKFSEWLKASFGAAGGSGNNSPTAAGNANALPPPPEWILPPSNSSSAGQPTAAARTQFHSHRQLCPSRNFPPKAQFNKNTSSNQTDTKAEPKFTHPLVLPILHGNFTVKQNAGANTNLSSIDPQQQHLAMHSAVTLVVDHDGEGNKRVLVVDTGLAALKHGLLRGLLANGVQPQQVDTVCITHPDTDTMGNLNLFPCADVHSGNAISRENLFARQTPPVFDASRSELPFRRLFAHTELFLTPGMSFQDQTLLVRGVPSHGTVAIVGKLILNEQDLFNNLAIREFAIEDSEHRKLWQATRREIVCMADYIVPGYGVPFKVNEEVRRLAECGMPRKAKNVIWPEKKSAR